MQLTNAVDRIFICHYCCLAHFLTEFGMTSVDPGFIHNSSSSLLTFITEEAVAVAVLCQAICLFQTD